MYMQDDAEFDDWVDDELDELERGIHGYAPLRPVCARCGAGTCRCVAPSSSSRLFDSATYDRLDDIGEAGFFDYADEMGQLADLADAMAVDDIQSIDAAMPNFARLAARALARPLLRRRGGRMSRPLSQQLARSTRQAARALIHRHGPAAIRAVPRILTAVRRNALRHRIPPRAFPRAVRQAAANVGNRPNLLRRLSRPLAASVSAPSKRRVSTRGFLNDALRQVSDPSHPLHFLVVPVRGADGRVIRYDWRRTTRTTASGRRQTGRYQGNESGPVIQVGHQGAFAADVPQQLTLEDADQNQLGGQTIESKGAYSFKDAVRIGGVPVDVASAQQWERLGLLPQGTVARLPRIPAPTP